MGDGPYSRVYWSVMDDLKFDGIRENVRHFGSWSLMLVVADMAWPAPGLIPRSVPKSSLDALAACGLVDLLSGHRYRIHGLDAERQKRSQSARNAAAVRWHSPSNADPMLDETRRDTDETSITPPPQVGRRENGTNPRATGTNPRALGTSPRQKLAAEKRDPTSIHDILSRVNRT